MHGSGETATFERVKKGTKIITPDGSYIAGESYSEENQSLIKRLTNKLKKM